MQDSADPRAPGDRTGFLGFGFLIEVFGLCGLVFVQPVLDIFGRSPEYFIFGGVGRLGFVLLLACLIILPPVCLWLVASGLGLFLPHARRRLHLAILAGLLALLSMEGLKELTPWRGPLLAALAVGFGFSGVALYLRFGPPRIWLRYLALAPFGFAAVFLGLSDVSPLIWAQGGPVSAVSAESSAPPVVMIVFDEFPLMSLLSPSGAIDRHLYPNFARFSEDATWFRNTTAVSGETTQAVPSLLTGRYPEQALAPLAADHPNSLFSLLAGSHELNVHESVTALCSASQCNRSERHRIGVRTLLQETAQLWSRLAWPYDVAGDPIQSLVEQTVKGHEKQSENAPGGASDSADSEIDAGFVRRKVEQNQPARLVQFIQSLDRPTRPMLHFLHILLPHVPYRYLPSGLQYPGRLFGFTPDGARGEESWPAVHELQKHLLQVAHTDMLFGKILDRLQETELYERSLVVVVSDHGVAFVPGDARRSATERSAGQVAWVPFFVKAPGQTNGKVSDRNVLTVDVLPTMADILDIEIPWELHGRSALGAPQRGTDKLWWEYHGKKAPSRQVIDGAEWLSRVLKGFAIGDAARSGIDRLYALGPFPKLVGNRVADQVMVASRGGRAALDDAEAYDRVEPSSGIIPAQISGQLTLQHPGRGPLSLALAINGKIAGVGEVFPEGPIRFKFSIMVSEQNLNAGKNDLQLFLLRTRGSSIAFEPLVTDR